MKTRAAMAPVAGKPVAVIDVNLDGPRAGEVLAELRALGTCPTDGVTLEATDDKDVVLATLGHEGAGATMRSAVVF